MPPSPTPSVESVKDASESANHSHIYDNLPGDQQQKTPVSVVKSSNATHTEYLALLFNLEIGTSDIIMHH